MLQTKKIFARHGILDLVISDNGPQYASKEYNQFSQDWQFDHYTSSPHHPRHNGTAEVAVKQAKRILKLSKDPWLAILEHRNTADDLASPNEKLNSRQTKTTIPMKPELLEPKIVSTRSIIQHAIKKKQQNKKYYDQRTKPLPPLVVGKNIRSKIRPQSSATWTQGTVVNRESDRSYIVKAGGRSYRRNRFHIRKSKELSEQESKSSETDTDVQVISNPIREPTVTQSIQSPTKSTD